MKIFLLKIASKAHSQVENKENKKSRFSNKKESSDFFSSELPF